jgi:general secretion pathway protein G
MFYGMSSNHLGGEQIMDDLYNRVARRRRSGQRGFTLIELLVVIAVLAVLAAIVIFNVTGVVQRGTNAACVTDLKTVQTASDAYVSDDVTLGRAAGSYATAAGGGAAPGALVSGELVPKYIHTWPTELPWAIDASGTITNTCPA